MRTLFFYVFARFARNVLGIFLLVLTLIILVDFVELLRRASDREGVSIGTVTKMAFVHAPSIAEQVLPFAVLFGSMATFLLLSRTLELVVARASGVSVWQFVAPGMAFALLLGILATTVYNPVSASLRAEYDRLFAENFGGRGSFMEMRRGGAWMRQESVDGQAVIHADSASDRGVLLNGVSVIVFDAEHHFVERVDARSAELKTGRWELADVRVTRPAAEPALFETYVISSNLSPEQVREIFGSTDSVSFWDLADIIDAAEAAGLSANRYRVRQHSLIAQPALFAAVVLIAATVSLRLFRFGNLARMILTGIAAGFVLYVFAQVIRDLGQSGVTSPVIASWTPALIAMLLSATVLLFQEDG